jgi:hypothetical protein
MDARRLLTLLTAFALGACSVVGIRSGTEEPKHAVVEKIDAGVEIRRYDSRLAADVLVGGAEEEARSAGFRKLAAFIFGDNRGRRSIAMTAPVAQAATAEPIAMTAPVAQAPSAGGQWRIRFFMPSQYSKATLPEPTDPDIRIVELASETTAVIRFSGVASVESVHAATDRLRQALAGGRWRVIGEPEAFFYDPPWTLPPLRRNEVGVAVAPDR